MMRYTLILALVVAAAVVIAGVVYLASQKGGTGERTTATFVTITDALGRSIRVPLNPQHIAVAGDSESCLTLLDLVYSPALDRVVAYNKSSISSVVFEKLAERHPALKTALDSSSPGSLARANPDVILVCGGSVNLETDKPVVYLTGDPLDPRFVNSLEALAAIFGVDVDDIEMLINELNDGMKRLADMHRPTVYLVGVGSVQELSRLVEAAGGRPLTRPTGRVPELILASGRVAEGSIGRLYEIAEAVNASILARLGRVCMIDELLLRGAYRLLGLAVVAKLVHPGVFREVSLDGLAAKLSGSSLGSIKPYTCTPVKRERVTLVDAVGRSVEVLSPAERIAVLYGLEDLVAVGGEEALAKLVALNRFRYERWRPDWWYAWTKHFPWLKDVPDVGQPGYNFNLELLLKTKPDVVIVARFMYERMLESGDLKRLEEAGIPVVVIDFVPVTSNLTRHLETVYKSIMALGVVTGRLDRAEELYRFYVEQIKTVVERLEGVTEKPRILVLATWAKWRAYGRGGMYQVWIEFAKGENIAASVIPGVSGDINPELVLRENPDVIVFTCNNNVYTPEGRKQVLVIGYNVGNATAAKRLLETLIDRPGWSNIRAVREGRVYLIHHGLSHGHIFQFAALQWLAKWLHPEVFKDLDPLANLREFYARFMPYELRGVWAVGIKDP